MNLEAKRDNASNNAVGQAARPPTQLKKNGNAKRQISLLGEARAAMHLEELGMTILARNWRAGRIGEIDVIAQESNGTLVIVEVKTRRKDSRFPDLAFETITWRKQRKMRTAAKVFMARWHFYDMPCRFDVIAVFYETKGRLNEDAEQPVHLELLHVPNAF